MQQPQENDYIHKCLSCWKRRRQTGLNYSNQQGLDRCGLLCGEMKRVRHLKLFDENPGEEPEPTFILINSNNHILFMKKHAFIKMTQACSGFHNT